MSLHHLQVEMMIKLIQKIFISICDQAMCSDSKRTAHNFTLYSYILSHAVTHEFIIPSCFIILQSFF